MQFALILQEALHCMREDKKIQFFCKKKNILAGCDSIEIRIGRIHLTIWGAKQLLETSLSECSKGNWQIHINVYLWWVVSSCLWNGWVCVFYLNFGLWFPVLSKEGLKMCLLWIPSICGLQHEVQNPELCTGGRILCLLSTGNWWARRPLSPWCHWNCALNSFWTNTKNPEGLSQGKSLQPCKHLAGVSAKWNLH